MKQIGTDFQGWPINIMTLKEILLKLGFEEDDKTITLIKGESSNEMLDSYPLLLEDDGMGYGVRPMFITEVNRLIYEDRDSGLKVFNLFRNEYRNNEDNIVE